MIKLTKKLDPTIWKNTATHTEYNISWDSFGGKSSKPMGTLIHRHSKDTYHVVWDEQFQVSLGIREGEFTYIEELEEIFTKFYQPLFNLFN